MALFVFTPRAAARFRTISRVYVQVHTDLECTNAMDLCAHLFYLTCYTSYGLIFFQLSSMRKLGRQGKFLCQLRLLSVLYSAMKKGETFSQASLGNKSVKKLRNEGDLENFAKPVTLFILAP